MYNKDYDAIISKFKEEIAALEAEKESEDKRKQGLEEFGTKLNAFYEEYSLTDAELLAFKSDDILASLKLMEKSDARPVVFEDLKVYFAKVIDKEGARRKRGTGVAKAASTGPKLAVGVYRNPKTGETLEKIKRNPKPLDNWIEEFGFDTVQSWKQ